MSASDTSPTTASPVLSADEIGRRFLKLIEGLKARDDLNLELVRTTLGLSLPKTLWDEHQFISEGSLDSDWSYVVGFLEETPSNLKSVYLDFRNSKARFAEMSSVCTLDFEYYHNALLGMGFMADPYYDYDHGRERLLDWRYTKFKKSEGTVDMTISIVPRNVVPGEAGRLCISSIHMLNGR